MDFRESYVFCTKENESFGLQFCHTSWIFSESLWSNYFDIGNTSGIINTTKELDRENVTTSIVITVTVSDCSAPENKSEVCDNYTSSNDSAHQNATVNITILDEDDNPPVFTLKEILVGMRRNVEEGSLLNLQLKVCKV